ncbi:MAG: SDR family oxidoreductase [Pseudomonadota bacterium]
MTQRPSVLITGASSGIGLALALHFEQQGFEVFAGVRRPKDGQSLVAQSSGHLTPLILDVTRPDTIEAALSLVQERTQGRLNGLINNAGVAFSGPLETTPQADVEALFQVNVLGTFAVTRVFLPLIRQARGRIVNVSSISGLFAAPGLTAYSASKFAVEGLTEALRVELAPFGVRVASVAPGKIDTPIWSKALGTSATINEAQSTQLQSLYRPLVSFYERYAEQERGTPINEVVAAVQHALCDKAPRARYVIGRAAKARVWLNRLPVRLRDRLILGKIFGSGG